ncbi:complement component 1 Q subcomponent-binding protein, mitochondrial [Orussus abietinus]|uniref:complement component 1 Q subcomponent-binding protein, mitochondrial n=1 Tax=Orussus abietinus TaxID=222816 RepID=UPI00062605BC|nr:complement component 1 Q subcomponent-binding protein, mitochondrial [Orussus abietinus]
MFSNMNGVVRNALRLSKNVLRPTSAVNTIRLHAERALWTGCSRSVGETSFIATAKNYKSENHSNCTCCRGAHTKAEKDLVEFLAEEIVAEKKAQKLKTIPTEVDGFKVSLDGAEVSLEKKQGDSVIKISFNVNHTVDAEPDPEIDPRDDKVNIGEMKSKPTFEIDIVRGNQTLGFRCSFNSEPGASGADDSYNDIFGIDEITLYEGEYTEKVYAVAGEVVDAYLYDLLMNYLEEKGITNEFAEKLVDLSTNYEHTAYISLLEGLSKFTSKP